MTNYWIVLWPSRNTLGIVDLLHLTCNSAERTFVSTVLLTGGSGFVGAALLNQLLALDEWSVIAATRTKLEPAAGLTVYEIGGIDAATDWAGAFANPVDTVVHCAARVHVMNDAASDPLAAFRAVNVEGTLNLARQAAQAGVRRFIFLSSIKVNGEATALGRPFTADDMPAPLDAYGISKLEAEAGLQALARDCGMEVVIIRPVLVYGPGVGANFRSMMKWLHRGAPLPLGGLHNARSLVGVSNLVDFIMCCMKHPAAAHQTFLVSDGEDVSTTQLLQRLSRALSAKARIFSLPPGWLEGAARIVGKATVAQRLCGNLQVDTIKNRTMLNWVPPHSMDEGLKVTADAFLRETQR
jgi:UDP-glucose 4-epimerase